MKKLLIYPLEILHWFYKNTISLVLGPRCRFHPSCSDYSLEAVKIHGVIRGGAMAFKRVLSCHPWHQGGLDPVPEKKFDLDNCYIKKN